MIRVLAVFIALAALAVWVIAPRATDVAESLAQTTICGAADAACEVQDRRYNILIPKGEGPFPVFLFFHGSRQSGDLVVSDSRFAAAVLARDYALIAPTALEVSYADGQNGTGWIWEGRRGERDDYRFVKDVLADATARFPLDPARMVMSGHSNGATFVWYFACAGVDPTITAFAPLGGTPVRGRPLACADVRPRFNLLHVHGAGDPVVPFDGSGAVKGWPGWLGAVEAVGDLAGKAGCRSTVEADQGRFRLTTWAQCNTRAALATALFDGGHEVPEGWVDLVIDWSEKL